MKDLNNTKTNKIKLIDQIKKFYPCEPGVKWLGDRTLEEFWNDCHRADWMMWYLGKMKDQQGSPTYKEIIYINVQIARSVKHLIKDQLSIYALDVFEKYALGNASQEEFINARNLAGLFLSLDTASAWEWASSSVFDSDSAKRYNLLQYANLIRTLWPFEKFKK